MELLEVKSQSLIWMVAGVLLLCLCVSGVSAYELKVETNMWIPIGSEGRTDVTLDSAAPDGIAGYKITYVISDPSIAEIVGVKFPAWAVLHNNSTGTNNVWVSGVDLSNAVTSSSTFVDFGSVVIKPKTVGSTPITVIINQLDGDLPLGVNLTPLTTVVPGSITVFDASTPTPTPTPSMAPVASFTSTNTYGRTPLTVQFTDTSANTPTSWSWDFGDGATSPLQNPSHTYEGWDINIEHVDTKSFNVSLTATNAGGSNTITKNNEVYAFLPYIAGGGSHPITGPAGTVFHFTGQNTYGDSPNYYTNVIVVDKIPPWNTPGSLPVNGVKPDDFSVEAINGNNATVVQVPVVTGFWEYYWDTSAIAGGSVVPGHEYMFYWMNESQNISTLKYGSYTRSAIGIEGPVHADYIVNISSGPSPLTVQFSDISTGIPTTSKIDPGDGSGWVDFGFGVVTHTYTIPGIYTPVIYANNSISYDHGTNATITVSSASGPAFTYSRMGLKTVAFTDQTTGTPTAWLWNFGDFTTSTEQNPVHPYTNFGAYSVTLSTDGGVTYATESIVLEDFADEVYDALPYVDNPVDNPDNKPISAPLDPVPDGTQIKLMGDNYIDIDLEAGHTCSLFIRDDDPTAQWEHPVTYICVEADGTEHPYPATSLPADIPVYQIAGAAPPDPGGDENSVNSPPPQSPGGGLGKLTLIPACGTSDCSHNYALLIDGGYNASLNHLRYWNDISFMYQTLNQTYGYPDSHIKVLMSDGTASSPADRHNANSANGDILTDSSPTDLDSRTTTSEVTYYSDAKKATILSTLRSSQYAGLTSADTLFIFTTGHGGNDTLYKGVNNTIYYVWKDASAEYINDTEFVNALPQAPGTIVMVMEQCNSGGFIDNFIKNVTTQKRIIATAATGSEPSYGNGFSNAWTQGAAMIQTDTAGTAFPYRAADADKNDQVSMKEVFDYAKIADPAASPKLAKHEHPQYETKSITGATTFLNTCTGSATKSISVKTPSSNEGTWYISSTYTIWWSSTGLSTGTVNISLWNQTAPYRQKEIGTVAAIGPSKSWTVPSGLKAGSDYYINISSVQTPTVYGKSPNFAIAIGSGTGTIKVNTTPVQGANISIDSVYKAGYTTNASIGSQTSGTHNVSVNKSGYYGAWSLVKLDPGTTRIVNFTLDVADANDIPANGGGEPYGSIHVDCSESGARVIIDGEDTGIPTPTTIQDMFGNHEVSVALEGYVVTPETQQTQRITIIPHETVDAYFQLAPVGNLAPVIEAGPDVTITIGSPFESWGYITDPNAGDTWTATVNYGEVGETPTTLSLKPDKSFDLSHTYSVIGTYTVTVTVNDGTSESTDTVIVTVTGANVAPAVDAGLDAAITRGSTFTQTGSFTDSNAGDTWTATVDYGDGSGTQPLSLTVKTFTLSHLYITTGKYTVRVTVTDNAGGIGTDTAIVTVSYTFAGFYSPVDMGGVVNSAKAGQAIPTKWHLTDGDGIVSDPKSFVALKSYGVTCGVYSGNSEDAIEEYSAGGSDLQYKGNGDWQYNWKTPKNYAGTCRNMYVEFTSLQRSPEARFKFK